ncbi:hypothetical protein AB5L52_46470 (plasmid) [Streptomyces sp. CG4]|uniref:hypothetical protein n=1 Tax=Streptomyces sp. CG4 TaxID=408783 RepID=UPI0034E1962B
MIIMKVVPAAPTGLADYWADARIERGRVYVPGAGVLGNYLAFGVLNRVKDHAEAFVPHALSSAA